jgi:hypothetical protein
MDHNRDILPLPKNGASVPIVESALKMSLLMPLAMPEMKFPIFRLHARNTNLQIRLDLTNNCFWQYFSSPILPRHPKLKLFVVQLLRSMVPSWSAKAPKSRLSPRDHDTNTITNTTATNPCYDLQHLAEFIKGLNIGISFGS